MGIFIFVTVVAFEIIFSVFCIITKSNQQKIRNIFRIVVFIGFVLFTILSVIEWSLRYYSLATILLLLSIIGTIGLIRKNQRERVYKTVRVIMKAIGMTLLILVVTLPVIIFPKHNAITPTGKYQVATVTYSYTDSKRIETYTDTGENRKLNVQMWYPENTNRKYPLIVFSHGAFGIKSSNESLYNELASHGYVVCAIDHTYQCLSTKGEDGHTTLIDNDYMQEMSAVDAKLNKQQSYEYYQKWMKTRKDDINFVTDYILTKSKINNTGLVYNLVDTNKIGVMGHSLGGSAALGIGRIRDDVSAVIALESPFMCDIEGVKDGKFIFTDKAYPVPVLNVYSDASWSHLNEWSEYAENNAQLTDEDETTFNVHISGVGHLSLTDFALTSPFLTNIFNGHKSTTSTEYCLEVINKVCLRFFDCYLKGEGKFNLGGTY